jgi:hypothetical protein
MSAWIVSKKHIDLLVSACAAQGMIGPTENVDEIGRIFWAENHKSVNYRYGENRPTPAYKFESSPNKVIHPAVVFKSLSCFCYQSCEHKGWEGSLVFAFCEELKQKLLASLPTPMTEEEVYSSPEYNDAPWGIK